MRQTLTPAALIGRTNAAFRTLLFGGGSLGALAAGLFGPWLGVPNAQAPVAIASVSMVGAVWLSSVRHIRSLSSASEDGK